MLRLSAEEGRTAHGNRLVLLSDWKQSCYAVIVLTERGCIGQNNIRFMEQTLLLNATYEPLKVVHWQKAMTLWCQGKVEVISVYDREVRSVSFSFKLPSVIRLLRYIKIKRQHRLRPVFARQHLRPGRSLVPVLRRGVPDLGVDLRSCGAGRPGRPQGLGKHRHLLHQLQPAGKAGARRPKPACT